MEQMEVSEDRIVQAILLKYKHPLSAVRHLLTFYNDLPAPTLERMTVAIMKQHPANLSGPIQPENRLTFVREGQKRKANTTKAVLAAQKPYEPPRTQSRRSPKRTAPAATTRKASTPAAPPAPGFFASLFRGD